MDKKVIIENVLTRREAEKILNITTTNMQYHLRAGNIKPIKEVGMGKGKIQLFWKPSLIKQYKKVVPNFDVIDNDTVEYNNVVIKDDPLILNDQSDLYDERG
ncbi:hypothetical protein [Macrococcoides bohemicum]|uniref:hypothetical protein n=1 Tax=Macrococcoides bohemicum TaxID=1903056 RepID=UPI00165E0F37|nr:hypothetical protein [Macrococcus bohemicus]MBC9875541.1 hypothetical protein [Macrococcus bohemicus]